MAYSFDLPRGNKKELGEALRDSLESAKKYDLSPVYAQSVAVQNYLAGTRNFEIMDPFSPGYTLLKVSIPRDQPAWEQTVGQVSMELGRQLRMDVRPEIESSMIHLSAVRDVAVTRGLLNYYFPSFILDEPHQAFQKYAVEDGCAGIAVSECIYPGRGWGLRLTAIPPAELLFLPTGAKSRDKVNNISWRRWVTLDWLKSQLSKMNDASGGRKKYKLPAEGSPDYTDLGVIEVLPGDSLVDALSARSDVYTSGLLFDKSPSGYSESEMGSSKSKKAVKMVEFVQSYGTLDRRHCERCTMMAGRWVISDEEWPEDRAPLIPIGVGVYADVAGPYGRSYAYPKIMAGILGERFILKLARNANDIDAYGMLLLTGSMGLKHDELYRPTDGGFRVGEYNSDVGYPARDPIQFKPINMGEAYGSLPQFMLGASEGVYPSPPGMSGDAPGRIDSDVALKRLDLLSNSQIAAGAMSRARAFAQVYAAGLEKIRDRLANGESVPLTNPDESMAGIILDTEEIPMSLEDQQAFGMRQLDEDYGSALQAGGFYRPQSTGNRAPSNRVAIGRFTIGPNVIPHPDEVAITIKSVLPRDKSGEHAMLLQSVQMGDMSIVEYQIEVRKRGLDVPVGGKASWNAYLLAVLNLLSVYGNGVEAGPYIVPVGSVTMRVGRWVVQTFMDSIEYAVASDTVKRQMLRLLESYSPVNTSQTQPTADEVAQMEQMRQRAATQGMSPRRALPQPTGP